MNKEEFTVTEIKGLSHNVDPSASGWLCFAKTRGGNKNFFSWYMTKIVTKFVAARRENLPQEHSGESFYLVADGEEIQLKPLEDDEVCRTLSNCNIDLGKGPASCTNTIGNACDRSNLFKASKKVLKSQSVVSKEDFRDPVLEQKIIVATKATNSHITSRKINFIAEGIVKVLRSIGRVINYQIVAHGFERIGMYPLDAAKCLSNCDAEVLGDICSAEIDFILSTIPELAKLFLIHGHITEQDMDTFNIRRTSGTSDRRSSEKDQRTQSQQRAVWVNNEASRERRRQWIANRQQPRTTIAHSLDQAIPLSTSSSSHDVSNVSQRKRRSPNRPREVIEAEMLEKEIRRAAKRQRQ
jgi:hypothetical protein